MKVVIIAIFFLACSEVQKNGLDKRSEHTSALTKQSESQEKDLETSSEEVQEEDEGPILVDAPAPVGGAFLHCVTIESNTNGTNIGCHLKDPVGTILDPQTAFESLRWYHQGGSMPVISENTQEFHAVFRYPTPNPLGAIMVDLTQNGRKSTLRKDLAAIFSLASEHRYIRMVLSSIFIADNPEQRQTFKSFEVNINGIWHSFQYQPGDLMATVGGYEIEVQNAKFGDLILFQNLYEGTPIYEIPDDSTFAKAPPHHAIDSPLYFQIDTKDQPMRVYGIRYNGGTEEVTIDTVASGAYDRYHMEYSDDGEKWRRIPGTTVDFDRFPDKVGFFFEYQQDTI